MRRLQDGANSRESKASLRSTLDTLTPAPFDVHIIGQMGAGALDELQRRASGREHEKAHTRTHTSMQMQ